jgi:hypothetical protein
MNVQGQNQKPEQDSFTDTMKGAIVAGENFSETLVPGSLD